MADPIWFWQRIVSPHMAGLATALAARGYSVIYVAEQEMSDARAIQGWRAPELGDANLRFAPTANAVEKMVDVASPHSIHICQGFRGNGLIGVARSALAARGLRQWVIMETVDDAGWLGVLKRLEYTRQIHIWQARIEGVLAIGHTTSNWLIRRGMLSYKVFPFTYFLPDQPVEASLQSGSCAPFRFLFVGQLITLKRVDLLIEALETLRETPFELVVVGSGPLEATLHAMADEKLPGRVRWLGRRPISEIPMLMSAADCLVLPSRHDGWGAVVSEALRAGTPAICSDACGAADVVRTSGYGGVFRTGDTAGLSNLLRRMLIQGRLAPELRGKLAVWARCLGAAAGAEYLSAILAHQTLVDTTTRPHAPWEAGIESETA